VDIRKLFPGRCLVVLGVSIVVAISAGCSDHGGSSGQPSPGMPGSNSHELAQQANQLFLGQKVFDPWKLQTFDRNRPIDPYLPQLGEGAIYGANGVAKMQYFAGQYSGGSILSKPGSVVPPPQTGIGESSYVQSLDMYNGIVSTHDGSNLYSYMSTSGHQTWPQFWANSDIVIAGDPEAQQVTHANMFYLAGSAAGNNTIPPMGLSSDGYAGHIFWDAEIWMFPALIVQHPDLAEGVIDYRFKHLAQACADAAGHGFHGAEYPWESTDIGKEEAPAGFDRERHITADVAFAAWQYYLWTGDKELLQDEIWPIMQACAEYWVSRAAKGADGRYHILQVIGPDEISDVVNDDAWTNAIVAETLRDAVLAAHEAGQSANPAWSTVAAGMTILKDPATGMPLEHAGVDASLKAKQADTQLLIYPLNTPMSSSVAGATLDYCLTHTISEGPAMTDSINALIAARLGRSQQSLDLFHFSYRPFMRGPWDAFSEKRTTNNVYFCTGMGGCLQTVLYGFAGLNLAGPGQTGQGKLIAQSGGVGLYANPHLPPGWTSLIVKGIRFRGHTYDVTADAADNVTVVKRA
jgi:trehalose/maltose hydrolase-like predicted phosphorylase